MEPVSEKDKERLAETVRLAQHGDREAFMELYRLYYHEMYAYACYMLRHQQDAEDVVADTVVAAFESIGRLRDVYRFRHWLFKILSNQCQKKRKAYVQRNHHHSMDKAWEVSDPMAGISDGHDMEQETTDREWVRQAFEVLSPEERYIVNSFLFGGYRGDEIAQSLGIGSSTLRSKYRRALQKMRNKLDS